MNASSDQRSFPSAKLALRPIQLRIQNSTDTTLDSRNGFGQHLRQLFDGIC